MEFIKSRSMKPIIQGKICDKDSRMLIDTGADYIFLNVPKYELRKNAQGNPIRDLYGRYEKEKLYLDAVYEKMIRDNYGSFVKDKNGDYVKTIVHGFGDITNECRLIILNSFSIDGYEFTDSYALLDENGFARNQDMIIGTACLRNFEILLNYESKNIDFKQISKVLAVDYSNIVSSDSNLINGSICLPADIYLQDSLEIYDGFEM